ncbi:MAG: Eco57I restriction-modification methylase domain-containing protein [Anaerolineae bacterium]|nr:Eco57I restriction-modification methylase domain-containing protein [Anaerolineae bacterium]
MRQTDKRAMRETIDLERLAQVIAQTGRPVHVNVLARAAVQARLEAEAGQRLYAPGAAYTPGETILLNGQPATVKAVQTGGNPKQGPFKILTLTLPDGTERHMAAGVPGAPAEDRQPVAAEQIDRVLKDGGPSIRAAIKEALNADARFVWFQDTQGDHCCLAQMLPEVGDEELARVWPLLQGLLADGVLHPRPTEELVKAIWGQENDGSDTYLLKAFALNAALQKCTDVRQMGEGWVLESEWRELQKRPVLVGPRQQNVVVLPKGVEPVEDDEAETEEVKEEEEKPRGEEPITKDLEAWRQKRVQNATIILKAQHYYGNWLPLTQAMRRLFPPRASGADAITFYHRFGGEEESFQAWVNWDQGRILGSPQMYRAFYEHGIYPGAKLVISHRGSEQEYEIRTKPVEGEQRVLVRRVFLAEDGTLEYEEIEEPVRYEIAKDVFVADARWEDLEALFRQAEEVGAGIFQLMYEKCCERWAENDRQPLYVTAEDLFQAIHFDDQSRLTSKATIAWELWRRLAFEPVGEGRYLFRPEFGDRVRSLGISLQKRKRRTAPCEEEEKSAPPSFERTGTDQLVAVDLIPQGPLFAQEQQPTATALPEERTEAPEPAEAIPPEKPAAPEPAPPPPPAMKPPPSAGGEPPGLPEPPPTPPRPERPRPASKSLFSTHYLEHRIREHPEWGEEVAQPFARLRALYEAKRDILPGLNEAQTETEFIRPALEILGFAYIPQTPTHRAGRVQRPDYALFADEAAKAGAYPLQDDEPAFYARALAIADAKYWERPLSEVSRDDPRDEFRNTNPSFQMVNYLTGTGVDWGILTNGRTWRLYYRQASSTATEFYEVDLVELLEAGDLERFKYFWLFFRREAFVKDVQGRNFLERVREGSATYARVIGERLKELVFENVFPFLSGGFVAYGAVRGEDVTSEEARRLIYEATLSLLYKLLFLFYAEARNLLPMDNPGYRAQSLTQMAQEIAHRIDRQEPLGQTSTALYDRLLNLFRLVDRGDRGLGLPRYNGGLFHFEFSDAAVQEKHRANWFLDRHRVSDAFLASALDLLYRAEGEPIDYGFIGVRHLGAIYEGLLEHRLAVDDAAAGRVHLETDKGERKATGSYYTPDYIVKYIVQHTVGPILEERAQRFNELMSRIVEVRRQLADERRSTGVPALRQELERLEHQARETLLDIKVCDPAMGSGHFLVEAVDFLTDGLIEILNCYPEHNPVLNMLDRIRGEIVDSLQRQGITIDPGRLDDTQLLQRVVMKRCIYGVDLNPMAVELAKVSLWLHSFTIGAPLSFLDHHLRCGNSLIGAMAREAHQQLSSELPLFGGPFAGLLQAAEIMRGISLLSDATFAEVEESERLFRQFDEAAKPYKRLLDIYVARYFGVKHADEFLRLYGADALQAGPDTVGKPYATVIREARRLYEEKRFFHWDLEFPEVFIDLERATWKENPGFDVVVGNPPYVRQEQLGSNKPFFRARYAAYHGVADLYVYFIERGLCILREGGQFSFIVSNKFMRANYGGPLRQLLISCSRLRQIVDFGELPVFEEAATFPAIVLFQKGAPEVEQAVEVARLKMLDFDDLETEVKRSAHTATDSGLAPEGWSLAETHTANVVSKTEQIGVPLNQYVSGQMFRGIVTGLNEAFCIDRITRDQLIHADPGCRKLIKPLIVGDDVRRYEIRYQDRYLIFARRGVDIEQVPAVRQYLEQFRERLEPRPLGHSGAWPGRKPGGYQWFEIQDTIDYWPLFEQPKIVYPDIAKEARFALDQTGSYPVNTIYVIPRKDFYLLALLNSPLLFFYMQQRSAVLGDPKARGRLRFFGQYMEYLPIRLIAFTTPPNERKQLVEVGITEAAEFIKHTKGVSVASVSFNTFSDSNLGRWLDERLSPIHTPDPELVRQHNAAPLNQDWQLPADGPVEQSDVVHDLLAHLAEQMIEMNKEKQAEVKGFLSWLEREIGAAIDDLTNKTRLRNYLGDYQKNESHLTLEELLAILRKNRRRLQVDPSARAFQERLAREYGASLDKLLPLKARLAATDRLIDLIVYRLYGLTEEEVAVVEGKSS